MLENSYLVFYDIITPLVKARNNRIQFPLLAPPSIPPQRGEEKDKPLIWEG
jgi:hypothetical protein